MSTLDGSTPTLIVAPAMRKPRFVARSVSHSRVSRSLARGVTIVPSSSIYSPAARATTPSVVPARSRADPN